MQDDTFLSKEEKKELKKQKSQKRGEWLAGIIVVLMFAGYGIWSVGFGIYGLFMAEHFDLSYMADELERYAVYEGDLGGHSDVKAGDKANYYCDMEHSINGLIPYAHEHYYYIVLDDIKKVISVRAGKHWGESIESGVSTGSIPVKGQLRRLDYKMGKQMAQVAENNGDLFAGYEIVTNCYLDLLCTKMNVLHIIAGLGILVVLAGVALLAKEKKGDETGTGEQATWIKESPMPQILLILFITISVLTIYVISVG